MTTLTLLGIVSLAISFAFTIWAASDDQRIGARQSRRQAIIEVWINIVVGFAINFVANILLLPMVGASITLAQNFWLGCIYTLISVLRSYIIRRYADQRIHSLAAYAAQKIST